MLVVFGHSICKNCGQAFLCFNHGHRVRRREQCNRALAPCFSEPPDAREAALVDYFDGRKEFESIRVGQF